MDSKTIQKIFHPIAEFKIRDVLQIIVGAAILATPVGFTEETWRLGEILPASSIIIVFALSLIFISFFSYYHYHRHLTEKKWEELVKRTFATYLFSFLVVSVLLTLIQKAPWQTDLFLALKRAVLVTLPASMSGALVDTLK